MAHRRLQMLWPAHALPSSAAATAATAKRHSPRPEISGDETRDTDQESAPESGIVLGILEKSGTPAKLSNYVNIENYLNLRKYLASR